MFSNASRRFVVVLTALAVIACVDSIGAANFDGAVQGVVKNSSGVPVSGAYVKLVNAERHLTFMVVSQAQGRYTAKELPAGKYTVQGIGGELQSKVASVDVASGKPGMADVSLTDQRAPMLTPDKPRIRGVYGDENEMREKGGVTLPEGDAKKIIQSRCTQCHDLVEIVTKRGDKAKWATRVKIMRNFAQSSSAMIEVNDQEAELIVNYLAKNFPLEPRPKADPNARLGRTLLQGDAAKYRIVEYDIPLPVRGQREFAQDPRGVVWLGELGSTEAEDGTISTEAPADGRHGGYIGKFDPNTLAYTEVSTPTIGQAKDTHLNGLARGQGDQIWMTDAMNRRLLRYDTKNGEFNVITVPKLKFGSPNSNTTEVAKDGSVWWTAIQANAIVNYNPVTQKFATYDVPSGIKTGTRAAPYGMAIAGDGKVWFAIQMFGKMGVVDPAAGTVEEIPIPGTETGKRADPRRVVADGNGDIWTSLRGMGKVLKVDHKTKKMTVYTLPSAKAGPYGIGADLKNNFVYVAEDNVDIIARFDPKTEKFVEYSVPYPENDLRRLNVDLQHSNRIWYSGVLSNRIGYMELLDDNGDPKK